MTGCLGCLATTRVQSRRCFLLKPLAAFVLICCVINVNFSGPSGGVFRVSDAAEWGDTDAPRDAADVREAAVDAAAEPQAVGDAVGAAAEAVGDAVGGAAAGDTARRVGRDLAKMRVTLRAGDLIEVIYDRGIKPNKFSCTAPESSLFKVGPLFSSTEIEFETEKIDRADAGVAGDELHGVEMDFADENLASGDDGELYDQPDNADIDKRVKLTSLELTVRTIATSTRLPSPVALPNEAAVAPAADSGAPNVITHRVLPRPASDAIGGRAAAMQSDVGQVAADRPVEPLGEDSHPVDPAPPVDGQSVAPVDGVQQSGTPVDGAQQLMAAVPERVDVVPERVAVVPERVEVPERVAVVPERVEVPERVAVVPVPAEGEELKAVEETLKPAEQVDDAAIAAAPVDVQSVLDEQLPGSGVSGGAGELVAPLPDASLGSPERPSSGLSRVALRRREQSFGVGPSDPNVGGESPQMAGVESPQMSGVDSPQMAGVDSPQMAGVESPQMADAESLQMADVESPQMADVESPQMAEDGGERMELVDGGAARRVLFESVVSALPKSEGINGRFMAVAMNDIVDVYVERLEREAEEEDFDEERMCASRDDCFIAGRVVYLCKREGTVAIQATVKTAGDSSLCFSWQKTCLPTWGQLEIIEVTSGLAAFRNNRTTIDWQQFSSTTAKGGDCEVSGKGESLDGMSSQFVFTNGRGTMGIKELHIESSNPEVEAVIRGWMSENTGVTQIDETSRESLDVVYRCPSAVDETALSTVTLVVENEAPLIPSIRLSWIAQCRTATISTLTINLRPCAKAGTTVDDTSVAVYKDGSVASQFEPGASSHFRVSPSEDCSRLSIVASGGEEVPELWPKPSLSYDRKALWMNPKTPEVLQLQNSVALSIPYTCLDETSTSVHLTLHLKCMPSISLEWMKDCRKPVSRTGWAWTARSAMGIGGIAIVAMAALCFATPISGLVKSLFTKTSSPMVFPEEVAKLRDPTIIEA